MKATSSFLAGTVMFAILGDPGFARGQSPQASSSAEAKALYNEAVAEMDRKEWSSACPKLFKATQMQPTAIGGRIELARCYMEWGKLASAYEAYLSVDRIPATRPDHVSLKQQASDGAKELRPKLATLTIRVPPEMRVAKQIVFYLDDIPVDPARLEQPFPIDKGSHTLVVSVNDQRRAPIKLEITADGTSHTVSVPVGGPEAAPALAKAVPSTQTHVSGVPAPSTTAVSSVTPRSPVPGFALGGVGLAGLIAGGALVGVAVENASAFRDTTPKDANGNPTCRRTATAGEDVKCADVRSSAASASTLGNVGVGVLVGGGVLVAAAAVYLLLPSKKASDGRASTLTPVVGREGGGLLWTGSF